MFFMARLMVLAWGGFTHFFAVPASMDLKKG